MYITYRVIWGSTVLTVGIESIFIDIGYVYLYKEGIEVDVQRRLKVI